VRASSSKAYSYTKLGDRHPEEHLIVSNSPFSPRLLRITPPTLKRRSIPKTLFLELRVFGHRLQGLFEISTSGVPPPPPAYQTLQLHSTDLELRPLPLLVIAGVDL
jgi:hypothetical protein